MPGNSFGTLFRITTFGESHGPALGVVIDGCPAGLDITREEIQAELNRRRPGQSELSTPRDERDQVEVLSGVFEGKTTGTPIALLVRNTNANSKDYEALKGVYRPGHADLTYQAKYGHRDHRGSGRASARETLARVAASTLAKKWLARHGISVMGYVTQIGPVQAQLSAGHHPDGSPITPEQIEAHATRCPDPAAAQEMAHAVTAAREDGDSLGGVIEVVATGVPPGLGEPVFHKLSSDLAAALVSIPAVKGFEIGDGFAAAARRGSQNNDAFIPGPDGPTTRTNHAGGLLGGLSSGQPIVVRIALKPPSSIAQTQDTVTTDGKPTQLQVHGRHDPCVCPRAVPIAEAMVALVLADHLLLNRHATVLNFRGQIETLDHQILQLLAQRFKQVHQLGALKREHGQAIEDKEREAQLIADYTARAQELGLPEALIPKLYAAIFEASKASQK